MKRKILIELILILVITTVYFIFYLYQNRNQCLGDNEVASYENDKSDFVGKIIVTIKNKQTNKTIFSFPINDVMLRNYNPVEIHNCGIYTMRSFNDDYKLSKTLPGFSKELWFYNYKGKGKEIVALAGENNAKKPEVYFSYNFRIDPNEKYLALEKGYLGKDDYSIVIKNLSDNRDVFTLYAKEIFKKYPDITGNFGLKNWTKDGRYFWGDISDGAYVNGFFRIDTENWTYDIYPALQDVLGGDALNVEKGYITVHPGNVWYGFADADAEEKAKRRAQGIGTELYIYNLFTKERFFVDKTKEALWYFKPQWLSDTELQYEMPNREKKVYNIEK